MPSFREDNEILCKNLDITPEWIIEKTGIKQRYLAGPDEHASDFALDAARKAMSQAKVTADQIDLIICCTFSGDYIFPPLSAKLHQELGAKGSQIFDLQANCTGVVTGLTTATDRMAMDPRSVMRLLLGSTYALAMWTGPALIRQFILATGPGRLCWGAVMIGPVL